jgi:hypothetical protein
MTGKHEADLLKLKDVFGLLFSLRKKRKEI